LENLSDSEDVNRTWENIQEIQNLSQRESRSVQIEAAYHGLMKNVFYSYR